ncbi:MAG TPA: hypothetical protein VI566_08350 [Xanthomonadales bacterium]|nr:hypothetical protein [Xanthomonadales bacterium]
MIQSVLMLLAPARSLPVTTRPVPAEHKRMATRPPARTITGDWRQTACIGLAVAGNALGLLLFLVSLGLLLRLAEVLLS